jgi:hypothetical protein
MNRLLTTTALIGALALTGCATPAPISANPIQSVANVAASTQLGGTVITGLQGAAWNLDQAIAIKVLPATDPADLCVHQALQAIGQDVGQTPTPVAQFVPKITDLLSAGSVAYILAYQAKQLAGNGGLTVPVSCQQIVGEFVLKGINAPANTIISGLTANLP